MPHVALSHETWKKLHILKLELGKKSIDEVVQLLLQRYEGEK
jgi:hypothetical protein